ncbi:MAG: alpha/beta fold hydrolase [Gemmatimonadota bacterium]
MPISRYAPYHWLVAGVMAVLIIGCGDSNDGEEITGPDLPTGPGRVYPVKNVAFTTVDGVRVSAVYGQLQGAPGPRPVVILVHDLGSAYAGDEWLLSGAFEELLNRGYLPLAVDLRGHGATPVPNDGRSVRQLLFSDLDYLHLDVRAALTWLKTQPSADATRVAIIGNGAGGNVAYVSMGAYPSDLKAGIALSPGLWESNTQAPLVVGDGIDPFLPHSMLFVAGADDILTLPSSGETLSYAGFATALATLTREPKRLSVLEGDAAHGLDLIAEPTVLAMVFSWLESHL